MTWIAHHGILGQKWGVRRYQNKDGSLTAAGKRRYSGNAIPPNTKFLKNYSGPAYFISSNDSLSELNPRVPDNYFTKNGYEDNTTPRISFAPSIDKCLAGLSQNVEGNTYSVYKPIDISSHKVFKPNPKAVPDSLITDELWICEPVKLEKVGSVKVTGNKGQAGKKFTYGDKTAELYDDWSYEMKELQHSDLYLEHHGILGQKWGVRRYQNPDGSLTAAGRSRYGVSKSEDKASTKNQGKYSWSNESISQKTKRYIDGDLDANKKRDTLYKEYQQEVEKLKKPSKWWKADPNSPENRNKKMSEIMTDEALKYRDKTSKLEDDYLKKVSKIDRYSERKDLKKSIFNSKEVASDIAEAKKVQTDMDDLSERIKNKYYDKGFEEYKKENAGNGLDDDELAYGYDHYEWGYGSKNEFYKQYVKEKEEQSAELNKRYNQLVTEIGNKITEDYKDIPVSKLSEYKELGEYEIDQYVRYGRE